MKFTNTLVIALIAYTNAMPQPEQDTSTPIPTPTPTPNHPAGLPQKDISTASKPADGNQAPPESTAAAVLEERQAGVVPTGTCASYTIDDTYRSKLMSAEGAIPTVYGDSLGSGTIGIGHLCVQPGCGELAAMGYTIPLSQDAMISLLNTDMNKDDYMNCARNVQYGNSNMRAALLDLCFQTGPNSEEVKKFIADINASGGNGLDAIAQQLMNLPTRSPAGAAEYPTPGTGTFTRRKFQLDLFLTPSNAMC